ncbi:hypothetical protein Taro_048382, partial [Colocasia esculenta]|nr:hypothetical protein [Colocasia esculenta]
MANWSAVFVGRSSGFDVIQGSLEVQSLKILASTSVDAEFFVGRLTASSLDINSELASRADPSLSAGARGKAVVRVVAADQAGNGELERGVRGAFLGFRRDSRFFGSSIAFLRVSSVGQICQPNCTAGSLFGISAEARQSRGCSVRCRGGAAAASLEISNGFQLRMAHAAREPRKDDARSMGVPSARRLWGVVWRILPLDCVVRGYETERWFLYCVVRVGYWHHEPVVHSRVVASFRSDSWFATGRGLCVVTHRLSVFQVWADFGVVYAGVVQTCTTSSRVVELTELVLPWGMPQ